MVNKNIKILAIESSCDETAAAVIGEKDGLPIILSNIISSQIDLHAKTGGVVPEVASRAHMEAITPVVIDALKEAHCELDNITHISVTNGPGLIGSLLIGFNAAKSLAYAKDLPIIPINHIEGHIYSAFSGELSILNDQLPVNYQLSNKQLKNDNCKLIENCKLKIENFPLIALTVSGGHTSLTLMKEHGVYEQIGQTIDDAVGEAYDKVAKLLDLGYPGGPIISKLAQQFRNSYQSPGISNQFDGISENCKLKTENLRSSIVFPRPIINDGTFNFSFSGLKTAVLQKVREIRADHEVTQEEKLEIAYAFEEAVADVLVKKTQKAVQKYQPKSIIFAGGVSANSYLKMKLRNMLATFDLQLLTPNNNLTGDNAAMIGLAAFYHIKRGDIKSWSEIEVDSNLDLVG